MTDSNEKASASNLSEGGTVSVPASETEAESKGGRRFSLMMPLALYEALEWLSKYDNTSVARVIVEAARVYTEKRSDDIEYIKSEMGLVEERLAKRKISRFT